MKHGSSHSRRDVAHWPIAFAAATALIVVCALGGGSPRVDPLSLLYVRPIVAMLLAGLLLLPPRGSEDGLRVPRLLLGAFAVIIAVQLVPLPPAIWLSLPGHARFAPAAEIAGIAQPWRPLSLTPMLTWNALAALLPAAAGLVAAARLSSADRRRLVVPLLLVVIASALLGTIQIATGTGYLYAVTSPGLPVGVFANRNHQAALLAASLPLLAIWAHADPVHRATLDRARPWLALAAALLVLVLLLVTGSRAGLALGVVGAGAAALLAPPLPLLARSHRHRRWQRIAVVIVPIAAIGAALLLGRALSVERAMTGAGTVEEQRLEALPTLLAMTRDFLPFGTGFGSFDAIFRVYEPDAALHRKSFNHAHNDLVELVLTGGLPALAILIVFVVWTARRALPLWRRRAEPDARLGLAGATTIAILLGASLADYPLRTPLLALVFAIATGWLGMAGLSRQATTAKPAAIVSRNLRDPVS